MCWSLRRRCVDTNSIYLYVLIFSFIVLADVQDSLLVLHWSMSSFSQWLSPLIRMASVLVSTQSLLTSGTSSAATRSLYLAYPTGIVAARAHVAFESQRLWIARIMLASLLVRQTFHLNSRPYKSDSLQDHRRFTYLCHHDIHQGDKQR